MTQYFMPSPAETAHRRTAIIALMARGGVTLAELVARLRPAVSERVVQRDLALLQRQFPGRIDSCQDGRAKSWRFNGDVCRVLERPLSALTDDQLTALIVARGLLHLPDPADAPVDAGHGYRGALACAVDALLAGMGLSDEAKAIAPDTITISRFGVAPEEDASFPSTIDALRAGDALRFTYTNLDGRTHAVHARPIRLAHVAGEWHLFSWAADDRVKPGKIKQYRLSRMSGIGRTTTQPAGCPHSGLRHDVAATMRDAFRATGSNQRTRVRVAVSPRAWPFWEKRRWGADQHITGPHPDLPPHWRRITFVTTGIDECRYFVMSFGAEVRVEAPDDLATWIRTQATAILAAAQTTDQTNSDHAATPVDAADQTNSDDAASPVGGRVRR